MFVRTWGFKSPLAHNEEARSLETVTGPLALPAHPLRLAHRKLGEPVPSARPLKRSLCVVLSNAASHAWLAGQERS